METTFREMRRNDKALDKSDALEMLKSVSFGTLAVDSVEGYPYSVPVSFAYDDNKIYFHGANKGLKYESINANEKVSFSVVEKDDVVGKDFTTLYRSAIAYGICKEVKDSDEIQKALELIVAKYSAGFEAEGKDYAKATSGSYAVFCIDIMQLTAKGKG